jgi:hypothetical protein
VIPAPCPIIERRSATPPGTGSASRTSIYSDAAEAHDAVTQVRSSHARTIRNLKRLIDRDIKNRAATIVIDQGAAAVRRTRQFLASLGVSHISSGRVREFGGAARICSRGPQSPAARWRTSAGRGLPKIDAGRREEHETRLLLRFPSCSQTRSSLASLQSMMSRLFGRVSPS